ncbi:MAG TPA: hypothetical protein VFT19_01270 [Solirubrobacterales bacterium]|nr:hypothetical protein [Solirubrobacterales bacterium]
MFGLARRERQRGDHDQDPDSDDEAASTRQDRGKLEHRVVHWLVSQPFAAATSRL